MNCIKAWLVVSNRILRGSKVRQLYEFQQPIQYTQHLRKLHFACLSDPLCPSSALLSSLATELSQCVPPRSGMHSLPLSGHLGRWMSSLGPTSSKEPT